MKPYVTLNGVSSADLGLRLVAAEPFILPARTRRREVVPGRLRSIASHDFEMPPMGYRLRLAAEGSDKGAVVRSLHQVAGWLLGGRIMRVWHDPEHYYEGAVEGEADFSMLTRRNGQLTVTFLCDPPCRQKALVAGGFTPSLDLPIPEQISATVKTVELLNLTATATLDAGSVAGSLPPALHLRLTGSWSAMQLGGLQITEGSGNTTLYIDCDVQEVYKLVTGTRTIVRHRGEFPTLTNGKLTISGSSLNLSAARLLVIERG